MRPTEPVPQRASVLLAVGAALLLLTTLTFLLSRLSLGPAAVPVALTIAVAKSLLIALFFMHLLEQPRLNALVFGVAVSLVVVLVTMTVLETVTRFKPSVPPGPFGSIETQGRPAPAPGQ